MSVPTKISPAYDGRTLDWLPSLDDRAAISIEKAFVIDDPKFWLKEKYGANITGEVKLIHDPRSGKKFGLPDAECYYIRLPKDSMKKYNIPPYHPECDTMFIEKSFFNSDKLKNRANIQKVAYHTRIKNNRSPNRDYYSAGVKILSYRIGFKMKDKKILDHLTDYEGFFARGILESVDDLREMMPPTEVISTVVNCENQTELLRQTRSLKQKYWSRKKQIKKKLRKLKSSYVVSPVLIVTGLIAKPYIPPPAWLVLYPITLIGAFAYPAAKLAWKSTRGKVLRTY